MDLYASKIAGGTKFSQLTPVPFSEFHSHPVISLANREIGRACHSIELGTALIFFVLVGLENGILHSRRAQPAHSWIPPEIQRGKGDGSSRACGLKLQDLFYASNLVSSTREAASSRRSQCARRVARLLIHKAVVSTKIKGIKLCSHIFITRTDRYLQKPEGQTTEIERGRPTILLGRVRALPRMEAPADLNPFKYSRLVPKYI